MTPQDETLRIWQLRSLFWSNLCAVHLVLERGPPLSLPQYENSIFTNMPRSVGAPVVVRAGRTCCLLPLSPPANLGPSRKMSAMTRASTRSMMSSRLVDEQQLRLESLRGVAREVPRALEKVAAESVGVWPGTAAAVMRVFDEESSFAREGSAGGIGRVDRPREGAEQEADGSSYKRLQMTFVSAPPS